ncbi:MAG: flagellar assembly protein FliW [Phycisphaeraceae bacterium]
MRIMTSRFGQVDVDDQRVIEFPRGLLGFPKYRKYVLIQPNDDGHFLWLQSIDTPELAFVVTDPSLFVQGYQVPLKEDQMQEMGLKSIEQAQVLVIVNKRGSVLTGNLQGPLVIHTERRVGEQLVLSDRRFHTRTPLLDLGNTARAATA